MLLLKDEGISTINSFTDPNLEWEIVETHSGVTYELKGGGKIEIPEIQFPDTSGIHTYIVTRKIKPLKAGDEVLSYDFVFGDVNFYLLYNDTEYRERFSKYIISRRGIDEILKKVCGALPIDVKVTLEEQKTGKFPEIERYMFDKEMMNHIITSVLASSHREVVDIEDDSSDGSNKFPKDFKGKMDVLEGTKQEKKPKKSFFEVFSDYDKEVAESIEQEKKEKEREAMGFREPREKIKEPDIKTSDPLVLFYSTGGIIITIPTYTPTGLRSSYDKVLVNRYNIFYKKPNTNIPIKTRSILIADVEERRLGEKGGYRESFVKDICIPAIQYDNDVRYENDENGEIDFFKEQEYRFMGEFNPSKEFSVRSVTPRRKWLYEYLAELNKREKEEREKTI